MAMVFLVEPPTTRVAMPVILKSTLKGPHGLVTVAAGRGSPVSARDG